MVNYSTNANKENKYLIPQIILYKIDHNMYPLKSGSWLGMIGTHMCKWKVMTCTQMCKFKVMTGTQMCKFTVMTGTQMFKLKVMTGTQTLAYLGYGR